jgi:adenylate kinase family enzyme
MNILEEIESLLSKVAYKPRIQRQHKLRGRDRVRTRQYYRKNRAQIKKRMAKYRKKFKNLLKVRRKRPSYKRVG